MNPNPEKRRTRFWILALRLFIDHRSSLAPTPPSRTSIFSPSCNMKEEADTALASVLWYEENRDHLRLWVIEAPKSLSASKKQQYRWTRITVLKGGWTWWFGDKNWWHPEMATGLSFFRIVVILYKNYWDAGSARALVMTGTFCMHLVVSRSPGTFCSESCVYRIRSMLIWVSRWRCMIAMVRQFAVPCMP